VPFALRPFLLLCPLISSLCSSPSGRGRSGRDASRSVSARPKIAPGIYSLWRQLQNTAMTTPRTLSGLMMLLLSAACSMTVSFAAWAQERTPDAAASPNVPPVKPPEPSGTDLSTITVEAARDRAILERRVKAFVSGITTAPYQQSLARWQKETPICPQVEGLPGEDNDYLLSRLSQIATAAGAPLAPESCKPNIYVIVTSAPDEFIAAWSKRNPWMFDKAGGTKIREFLHANVPVRVWYSTAWFNGDGIACKVDHEEIPVCEQDAQTAQIHLAAVRDFSSVLVVVDARQAKEVTLGQLAAYVAVVGLAEIRVDAKLGDAPTILHLFTDSAKAPALGLSAWDTAYLKALYQTEHKDKTQLLAVKTSVLKDVAP
jgi:hypothetical protein